MHRFLILILFLPVQSFATCTPEVIQFYLDKGFNQEQITKLCASSSDSKANTGYQPYQKPVVIVQEGVGVNSEERKATNIIRGGLDGRSVDVTPEYLNYITKVCVKWDQAKEVDQRFVKCIDVAFSISRDDLKVAESGSGFLFYGKEYIEVSSSSIIRKYVTSDPWEEFPPDIKFLLKRKYEAKQTGNTTKLPLRKTADPSQMVNAIRTIADYTKAQRDGTTSSEVARVLDESYVPPTEEEYLASQPTYEEIEEDKKNKKKWWNPFD